MPPRKNYRNSHNSNQDAATKRKAQKKKPMLNLHRIDYFKWDLNIILDELELTPEEKNTFRATIIAKASKITINEAVDYVEQKTDEKFIDEKTARKIKDLLFKHRKWR